MDGTAPAIPDYTLIRLIGQGAYGDVWLAQGLTGLYRAVKIVWRDRFPDATPFDREFSGLKEFAAISLTESRHLALLHVGRLDAAGCFYYVMELADDAETGAAIVPERYVPCTLRELRLKRGRLPAAQCLAFGVELVRGLAGLHRRGLVHRDIKPSNIIVVNGVPKLADIGLVTSASGAVSFVGTEGFVAPEGPGTPAADIYSLGKVLYEAATGFDRAEFPRLPADLADAGDRRLLFQLNEIILRACEPNPEHRYRDADGVLADLAATQAGKPLQLQRRRRLGWGLMAVAAVAAGLAGWAGVTGWRPWPPPSAATAPLPPTAIAVLPFENLSPNPEDAFFTDGMHEDVILSLAKIHGLRVTSRTSVMVYKTGSRSLRAIAADLGVSAVVEGSVQRNGQRVRVSVQLIDADRDQPIWAEQYDEELKDVFVIQSDLAAQITAALRQQLRPDERVLIAQRPTSDPAAYDLYLQARAELQALGNSALLARYDRPIAQLEEAVHRDPTFALAFAELSLAHSGLFQYSHLDPSPRRLGLAREAAAQAERLAPDLPQTRLAMGVLAYLGEEDWGPALENFRQAEAVLPNDDTVLLWIGKTEERLGRWSDALRCFRQTFEHNPGVYVGVVYEVQLDLYLRRFAAGKTAADDYLRRFPGNRSLTLVGAYAQLELDHDREAFMARINALPSYQEDTARLADRVREAIWRRDWSEATRYLLDSRLNHISSPAAVINDPPALLLAMAAFCQDQPEEARRRAQEALLYYRSRPWSQRQMPWVLLGEARAEAYGGQVEAAVRDVTSAYATLAAHDQMGALVMHTWLGHVLVAAGRREDAFKLLREAMTGPCFVGPEALTLDPVWERLAADPRFAEILAAAKPLQ